MRGEFVDIGGIRLYCYAAGSRGVGAPIVLIHGAFTSSHLWKDLLPRLPKGHRVLVLDLLGHGRSDPPKTASMAVADHAKRVQQLMDIMGVDTATVVGHGMGAAIALHLAHIAPARVAHLVLVDPDFLAAAPEAPNSHVEKPDGTGHTRGRLHGRLYGRLSRLAFCEPLWRRLAPGWLASELHAAMLPSYARRDIGARALDSYLVNYRSREGREAACAQLRALKRSAPAHTIDATTTPSPPSITVAAGILASRRSQIRLTQLAQYLHRVTGNPVDIHQLAGAAYMAPEEAPDRLGTVVSEVISPPHTQQTS